MTVKRVDGSFPIFAEGAVSGDFETVSGKGVNPYLAGGFYKSDISAYNKGFTGTYCSNGNCKETINTKSLNGIFKYITEGISYLYHKGIPEYSLGVAYDKGSVVTFKGAVYVSFVDNNTRHVSQSSHWGKLSIEPNQSTLNDIGLKETVANSRDTNPIGTILTVPNGTAREGYIDYIEGGSFNRNVYPELFQVLKTTTFSTGSGADIDVLPIGSIVSTLSTDNIPVGWVEWKYAPNSLLHYPELLNVVKRVYSRLADNSSKAIWEQAIANNTLPNLGTDVFLKASLGYDSIGTYSTGTIGLESISMLPVVIDESNVLSPVGLSRCTVEPRTYSVINSGDNQESVVNSNVVLVGQRADKYTNLQPKNIVHTFNNSGAVNEPTNVTVKLLVKAKTNSINNVPATHKQIIKALNV